MTNYTKKAVHGVSTVFAMGILASVLAYMLRLLLARNLSYEGYGLVSAIMALFGIFTVFQTLGLNSALVKYIAEFRARKEFENIKNSIVITFVIQSTSTFILGIIFIIFSDLIAMDYFHEASASFLIKIYAIGIMFSPAQNIAKAIFQGFQRMGYFSLVDLLKMLFVLVLTYLFLEMKFSVLAPILSYTLVYILPPLLYFPIILKKIFPEFIKIKTRFDSKIAKNLVAFGIPVIFTEVASTIFVQIDTVIITLFRSLTEVAIYNAGMPTASILWKLTAALSIVLLPLSSELWAIDKKERIKKGLFDAYKYSTILILPASLIMFIFPEIILKELFGGGYVGAANVLRILSIGSIIFTVSAINNSVLIGIGQPKEVSKIMLIGSLFNLIGNLIFIPIYGIEGAAVTTSLSFMIMMFLSISKLKELVHMELPAGDFIKMAFAGILFSIVVFSVNETLSMSLWTRLFISIILGLLVYTLLLSVLRILTFEEINKLLKRII